MATSAGDIAEVQGALEALSAVLATCDRQKGRSWNVNTTKFLSIWQPLRAAISDVVEIINEPRSGQGLASLWLQVVSSRTGSVEGATWMLPSGWDDVLERGDANLAWLINHGRQSGRLLINGRIVSSGEDRQLAQTRTAPLKRLRNLAVEWGAILRRMTPEVGDRPRIDIWETCRLMAEKTDDYVRQSGLLILEAVDSLAIKRQFMCDSEFAELVVSSFEKPENLATQLLSEPTPQALLILIKRLQSSPSEAPVDETSSDNDEPDQELMASYPTPKNYVRDKWVYDNIQLNDFPTLSKLFKRVAISKKWKKLQSRNSFKYAADRYAKYRKLEQRRFQ